MIENRRTIAGTIRDGFSESCLSTMFNTSVNIKEEPEKQSLSSMPTALNVFQNNPEKGVLKIF